MKNIIILFIVLLPFAAFSQLTEREQQVLDEINLVRTDPVGYIQYIDSFLEYWDSNAAERATAEELKKQLKKMEPLQPLEFSQTLYDSAKKHGAKMVKTKVFEHSNCDCAENIQYGNSDVRYAILDLLIDHGVSGRGHRKNILNPEYKYFAVYEVLGIVGDMEYIFIQQFDW
jgi:hypothetical protein